jgi:hypothetical protein
MRRRHTFKENAMTHTSHGWRTRLLVAVGLLTAAAPSALADGPEVYRATAALKTAAGTALTAPVVISISHWTTDAEREKAVGALKAGGTTGLQKEIAGWPEAGFLQLGESKTPIRFARTLPVGGGKVVTVATAQSVFFVGAGAAGAKAKAGYDVAVAIFQVDAAGKGDAGDLAPAAKVKLDERGALIVEDYGAEAVRLMGIAKQ